MATRQELLDTFEASLSGFLLPARTGGQWTAMPDTKSAYSERTTSLDGQHTIETHICYFWDAGALNKRNAQFYVVDAGTENEVAVWIRNNDPAPPTPEPTFTQELTAWLATKIDTQIGANTLRHVEAISANDLLERAVVDVIMQVGTDFVRQSAAVWKDASEVWQFKALT